MNKSNQIRVQFFNKFALSSLNIDPICFKNLKNPSCIDPLLTNFKSGFMKTNTFETGISDHHKIIFTIIKHHFRRETPNTKF